MSIDITNKILETFNEYYRCTEFKKFQNSLAQKIHKTLATSYNNNDNEVKMVTTMCENINGENFKNLKFHAYKIHGTRSYVEFERGNITRTKELADMVIISVITEMKEIVYEKTASIQNKKEKSPDIWEIDQDQLYLLQNFPTFKGKRGILKNLFQDAEVVFMNHSGSLGKFGLLKSPNEMAILDASLVFRYQNNKKISFADIRKYTFDPCQNMYSPFFFNSLSCLSFLNNNIVSYNIHEFVRNWTLFNLGECVRLKDEILDAEVSKFNQSLYSEMGLSDSIKIEPDNEGGGFENEFNVIVLHLDLD